MTTILYIHHVINLIFMITLFILNFTNFGGTLALIVLAILFIINTILLIRANSKQVKNSDTKPEDFK